MSGAARSSATAYDWLLPQHERSWRRGCGVEPLVHGATYFARLLDVVEATQQGDEICLTDWRGDADQLLSPEGPSVAELFVAAVERGVTVRALLWRSHSDKVSFSSQENEHLGQRLNRAGAEALLDERVRRGGSHHQKVVVVRHRVDPSRDVAFVGGIDLCHSRRDDATHAGDRQRQPMDRRYGSRPPWHDTTLQIRGPAVADVWATFTERWNDPSPVDHHNPYRRRRQRRSGMPRRAQPIRADMAPPPRVGEHVVQVLRTYPAKRHHRYPFAPRGERSIARAYERAFARAERLVYIEDQYLWARPVARALAAALRRAPALQVIALVPRYPDADGRVSGPLNRLGQIEAMELLHDAGGDRVAVYDVHNSEGTPIYVHAKVCVIDDVWMAVGSDNVSRRSWSHDSEAACAVVDPDGDLPARLRRPLWAEHLDLPEDHPPLSELDRAVELWRSRSADPTSRVRAHRPAPVHAFTRLWAHSVQRLVYDPDGRPLSLRVRRAF